MVVSDDWASAPENCQDVAATAKSLALEQFGADMPGVDSPLSQGTTRPGSVFTFAELLLGPQPGRGLAALSTQTVHAATMDSGGTFGAVLHYPAALASQGLGRATNANSVLQRRPAATAASSDETGAAAAPSSAASEMKDPPSRCSALTPLAQLRQSASGMFAVTVLQPSETGERLPALAQAGATVYSGTHGAVAVLANCALDPVKRPAEAFHSELTETPVADWTPTLVNELVQRLVGPCNATVAVLDEHDHRVFGAPALVVQWRAATDDPATGSDDPATGSDDPATGSDDPTTGSDGPLSGEGSPEHAAPRRPATEVSAPSPRSQTGSRPSARAMTDSDRAANTSPQPPSNAPLRRLELPAITTKPSATNGQRPPAAVMTPKDDAPRQASPPEANRAPVAPKADRGVPPQSSPPVEKKP